MKRFIWKLKDREIQLGDRTLLVGVLNVTPESSADEGRYADPDRAFARAIELEEQGADIINIGAESMRSGAQRVSEAEESRRLVPVLKRLRNRLSVPISVSTYKSVMAEKALELGVEAIDDPSSLTFDPQLAKTVTKWDAGLVLNHMRGTPDTWAKLPPMPDPMGMVASDLQATVNRAIRAGVGRQQLVLDPGLGFGKRKEQNYALLARLAQLVKLGFPVMVGPSKESFLGQAAGGPLECATAAAVTAAVLNGAHLVRVHDVRAMRPVVQVADEVVKAQAGED
jgi:dihydropteroate synthase